MRQLTGIQHKAFLIFALLWAVYGFFTAFRPFHQMIQTPLFAMGGLVLAFGLHPWRKGQEASRSIPPLDWLFIVIAIVGSVYIMVNYDWILRHVAQSTTLEIALCAIMIFLAWEGCRRTMGLVIPVILAIVLLYTFLGQNLPTPWGHAGFQFRRVAEVLYLSTYGLWGMITYVVSTIIYIYVILGNMLLRSGGGRTFIDIASLMAGRFVGGGAKVALFASALFGTIQGTSVANVMTTGSFTIPMMKEQGFPPSFAGAAEAVASDGGQIMPPVMGAAAFIMAELLGVPYISICAAALLPAIIYFTAAFFGIHFEAHRLRLSPLPKEKIPKARDVFTWARMIPLFVPIGVLIFLLLRYYTPPFAGFYAVVTSIILFLAFAGFRPRELRARLAQVRDALVASAHTLTAMACLCLCVQLTISLITFTGIGVKLAGAIVSLGGTNFIAALLLTAVTAIFLGMGIPTTAAYILGITVLGWAMMQLGLPPLTTHLFIFYFAVLANITPPVCVAVYAAATITGTSWVPMGFKAVQLGLAGFIVPFMFVAKPALLMQGDALTILVSFSTSIAGVTFLASAAMGYLIKPLRVFERILLAGSACCFIIPGTVITSVGIGLLVITLLSQRLLPDRFRLFIP